VFGIGKAKAVKVLSSGSLPTTENW